MKILIVEDESLAAKTLANLIHKLLPAAEILATLATVQESIFWFKNNKEPDLMFLDIQLADGNSFEIFETLQCNCPVIFTTAYDQFAIRAFQLNSIDYLLKPLDEKDVQRAISKYEKIKDNSPGTRQLQEMLQDIQSGRIHEKKYKERFLVMHKNALRPLHIAEISYFQKEELIFAIDWEANRYITDFQSMDELQSLLNPELFFRANRQFIVQINAVNIIKTTYKGISAVLKKPMLTVIDISREKARDFKAWLEVN
ncbi:MAG: response regulator transcription factor [Cyclobacteriaceae bacterium]|nr:response regulator transcription factor [Cyclobacteriaceae bacterium]